MIRDEDDLATVSNTVVPVVGFARDARPNSLTGRIVADAQEGVLTRFVMIKWLSTANPCVVGHIARLLVERYTPAGARLARANRPRSTSASWWIRCS
jgi:hypothetical protein